MGSLVVVGFPKAEEAEQVRRELVDIQREQLIALEDAVVVEHDAEGQVHLRQAINLTAAGALGGGFWGTLVGLLLAGLWVVPVMGKMATARLGCQLIALSLLLLLVAGLTAKIPFLQAVMVLFGLAAGIGTNSALCLMLDLTLPQAAGTFVGVWGLAQALSRAIGKLLGGGLYDIGRSLPLGDGPYGPFALVLGVELLVALAALVLLARVNVRQFREDTSRSLSQVLELELG